MFYVSRGNVPHKRHTQHRAPDGSLYAEELFGDGGLHRPILPALPPRPADSDPPDRARPRDPQRGHGRWGTPSSAGQDRRSRAHGQRGPGPRAAVLQQRRADGRRPARPSPCPTTDLLPQRRSRRDAVRPRGDGHVREHLRPDEVRPRRLHRHPDRHDLAPRPTTARSSGCCTSSRRPRSCRPSAIATTGASCSSTRRSRSATSASRTTSTPRDEKGDFVIWVRVRGRITAYHYRHHPFDVVGWDGYLFPFIFNIGDFEPITGRVHQPPPVHQTFAGRNYVVCSFVPRKFDYHPLAIPAPYNHSNINCDEVIYYVAGNFMSRRGVEISSFTSTRRAFPTDRIRARSRRRSARRRPRSWR